MWDRRLQELLEFQKLHGHPNVPRNWRENPALAHWVTNQRRQLRLGRMSPERRRRLEGLAIGWTGADQRRRLRDHEWNRMCDVLCRFHRLNGHCDVPSDWPEQPDLAGWAARQRHLFRNRALREDRVHRFQQAGIDWTPERGRSRDRDDRWDRLCDLLTSFAAERGHPNVPKGWPKDPALARWVVRQRLLMRRQMLRPDRRRRLEALGLGLPAARLRVLPENAAGPRDDAWREMADRLAAFQRFHGHPDVPRRWPADPALARWVCRQRELQRRGRLRGDRQRHLDHLGLDWSGARTPLRDRDLAWTRQFDRLAAFRREQGHCDVPAREPGDPALGRWVAVQRSFYKCGKLRFDRFARLTSLGFTWPRPRSRARTRADVAT